MITYVNTVFVSNANGTSLAASIPAALDGQFILLDVDANTVGLTANTSRFRIGMGTGKTQKDMNGVSRPIIKWSNIINVADIKKISVLAHPSTQAEEDSEDTVVINFTGLNASLLSNTLSKAGKRIIVRLTFKDMPHRFRKWTESYEYVTKDGDTKATIATGIATAINKEWKRARVNAVAASNSVTITALPYDDDNSADSLNWANKVRFNANIYYTDPAAEGWESLNKHFPTGVTVTKTPGSRYPAYAKLVRDREAQAMGYLGILNHGEGTWPIIQPAMRTNLSNQYNAITLEFENMYRTADDLFRKTKQTVEIYTTSATAAITNAIKTAMGTAVYNSKADETTENPLYVAPAGNGG